MAVEKVDETFYEATGTRLLNTSQLKLFNILRDTVDDEKFLNIFRAYSINSSILADTTFYTTYQVGHDEWWDNISYALYGTPRLWWVLALMNDVVNPFEELVEGTNIKVLRAEYLYTLFKELEGIADL